MKKIIVGFSLIVASSLCLAAATVITNNTDGVASADLTNGECGVIATGGVTAKLRGSKDVRIAYDCDSSAAGVGTAHHQGKGLSYAASSNGGALKKTDNGTGKFESETAAGTAAGTAATAAKTAS